MKKLLQKILLVNFMFIMMCLNCFGVANVYYWTGANNTSWVNYKNWNVSINGGAVIAATTTYPFPGTATATPDIASIGVTAFTGFYPTLSTASYTIGSLIFGTNGSGLNGQILTVTGQTLTTTGNIQQNFVATSSNNIDYNPTILSGTGTIICNGNFVLGDGTVPTKNYGLLYILSSQITQLTIQGNIVLNAYGPTTGNGQNYPCFSHDNGKITLLGQITTTTTNTPKSSYFDNNYGANCYPGIGQFVTNTSKTYTEYFTAVNGGVTTLELQNKTPISPAPLANFYFYFDAGAANGTVIYDDPNSENQTVYTSTDADMYPISTTYPDIYCNLTLSAVSTKVPTGGLLTIGYFSYEYYNPSYGNFTTSGGVVSLSANPTVSIWNNWTNTATVNQGSGLITVNNSGNTTANVLTSNAGGIINEGSGGLTDLVSLVNNSGATINGYSSAAATSVTGTLTNGGNITCNAENMTYTGAATNTGTITGGAGTLTFGSTFTNNALLAAITTGAGTATFTGAYTNTLGAFTAGSGSVIFNSSYSVNGTGTNCTFTAGNGTVFFTEGTAVSIIDKSSGGTVFNNVTFNGTKLTTIAAGTGNFAVSPSGTLTMVSPATLAAGTGSAGTAGTGYLTLNSSAAGCAAVAPITTGTPITGYVNVQRYISGVRGYRYLSSPVYVNTASGYSTFSINYLKNSLYLTGTTGSSGGFTTPVLTTNPTLYIYDENLTPSSTTFLNSNYIGISSITTGAGTSPVYGINLNLAGLTGNYALPLSTGYLCFYRGNLSQGATSLTTPGFLTSETPTITTTSGLLVQGQVIFRDWYNASSTTLSSANQQYNFIGNPYASAIDLEKVSSTGPSTQIYVTALAPLIGTLPANCITRHVYEVNPVNGNTNAIYTIGGGGSYPPLNGASEYISSGQAFLVIAEGNPQLYFNETGKATSTNATAPGLMAKRLDNIAAIASPGTADPSLLLKMSLDSLNNEESLIVFDPAAKTSFVTNEDALHKNTTGYVGLSTLSSDNIPMVINTLPLQKTQAIPLKIYGATNGIYTIKMTQPNSLPALYDIWLKDAYTKDSLDIKHNPLYSFNIDNADTSTYGAYRLSLVIRQNPALMVHLLSFTVNKVTPGDQVVWTTENEQNYTSFAVQRSTDGGKTFTLLEGIVSSAQGTYSYLDKNPVQGANSYRLQLTDLNGTISYSNIVTIMYANTGNQIAINGMMLYPNPTSGTVNLAIDQSTTTQATVSSAATTYNIQIINNLGSIIKTAVSSSPNWQTDVSTLIPGTYFIKVTNASTNGIVGKSAFVKL